MWDFPLHGWNTGLAADGEDHRCDIFRKVPSAARAHSAAGLVEGRVEVAERSPSCYGSPDPEPLASLLLSSIASPGPDGRTNRAHGGPNPA